MNQINCVLSFPVLRQRMASANMELYHHLDRFRSIDFIYTLLNFQGHRLSVGPLCSFGIRTNLFDFLVFIRDIQAAAFPKN